MNNAPVTFVPTTIPAGLCFGSEQERFNWFASHLQGSLPGTFTTWNIGNSEPAVNDRDKPWLRLNGDGSLDKAYYFYAGQWLAPHPYAPNAGIIVMWEGTLADVDSFDGGTAGVVTDTTGPMWAVVAQFAAAMPIGVGTLPSTKILAVGDTGGEENHTNLLTETPPHSHLIANKDSGLPGAGLSPTNYLAASARNASASTEYTLVGTATQPVELKTADAGGGGNPVETVPHNNLPPYRAVYFLRRSNRRFYTTS